MKRRRTDSAKWPVGLILKAAVFNAILVTVVSALRQHLEGRRIHIAGITRHPDQEWMAQVGRSATQETWGYLHPCRYVLHDRNTKFCESFRSALASGGVKTIALPAKSPNVNAAVPKALGEFWSESS